MSATLADLSPIRHAHALPAVAAEGNVADLDGRRAGRLGDGVLVHHPPDAAAVLAFAHVQVEVADVDRDLLAADAQALVDAALRLPNPDAAVAAAVLASAGFLVFAGAHDEVGLALAPHAVALEEVPGQRAPRRVVLEDDAGEWVLATGEREEVEFDELELLRPEPVGGWGWDLLSCRRRHGWEGICFSDGQRVQRGRGLGSRKGTRVYYTLAHLIFIWYPDTQITAWSAFLDPLRSRNGKAGEKSILPPTRSTHGVTVCKGRRKVGFTPAPFYRGSNDSVDLCRS